jgi:hypothetical protein
MVAKKRKKKNCGHTLLLHYKNRKSKAIRAEMEKQKTLDERIVLGPI